MWIKPNEREVQKIQFLNEKGELIVDEAGVSDNELIEMYKWMIQARTFDQRAMKLQRQGKIGTYAPMIGQEAAQIGSAYPMAEEDWIYPSYREVGACLVRGIPMANFFLYTMGHLQGANVAGTNVFPVQIIISAQCVHAVGGAWASQYKKESQVSVAYVGDGGTSEGDFHEALNFAGVYELPVVFFVQNNQYAISVPVSQQTASESIAQKALAYGISGVQVDGNDVLAVHATMKGALAKAREGKPVLVEAITYRQGPHTTADDPRKYRDDKEVEQWLQRDPILRVKQYMLSKGVWTEEEDEEALKLADEKVTEAFEQAVNIPQSEINDLFDIVYEEKTSQLIEQQQSIPSKEALQ